MSMEYRALGTLCTITSSKRIFADQYVKSGIPFYRSKEIIERNNNADISELLFISPEVYASIKAKFGAPKEGDLLLTSVGTIGIPYIVKKECFYFKDGNLTWMKDFSHELSSRYVYYWLSSSFGKESLINRCIGSSQAALTIDILKKYKILVPDRTTQDAIVSILSSYDRLIEVNNKRIKVLEQMAENLYKEWFVRFRFPGHETAEFENGLPKGWEIKRCRDIVPVLTGKKDANYGDYGGPYPFFTCAQEPIQAPDYSFDCNAVLLAGNCDLNAKVFKGKFEAYQRTYVLSPYEDEHLFLLYYVIKDNVERLKQASTGAAISFITKGMIERIHFLMPPIELLLMFHGTMDNLYRQKDSLLKQNKNLIKQRDLLLPRLMSGKLEV